MFMVLRKKQMILTALVLMLGIAGYLNYRYDEDREVKTASVEKTNIAEPEIGETVMVSGNIKPKAQSGEKKENTKKTDVFALEKHQRDSAREKTREELMKILSTEGVSAEIKDETQRKLAEIADFEEKEIMAQNMLKAKGYEHTMVYITGENVTVTVKRSAVSRSDMAKIVDVIFELTQNNNVKIVEVK